MICLPSPLQPINLSGLFQRNIRLLVKRDDLLHPEISGNKWRKLRYNLERAEQQGCRRIVTFGGAYSNHIAATAAAGRLFGFASVGIIRGERHELLNPTLQKAVNDGMALHYVDRKSYRNKNSPEFRQWLDERWPNSYVFPEGGANRQGVRGCEAIVREINVPFDVICCACGTGTTLAGIISALAPGQRALGFSVLKGDFMKREVETLLAACLDDKRHFDALSDQWEIYSNYHFGGYARVKQPLLDFMAGFYDQTGILSDPVYTGKLFYGVMSLLRESTVFDNKTVVVVHSGGLQGIAGMEQRLKRQRSLELH